MSWENKRFTVTIYNWQKFLSLQQYYHFKNITSINNAYSATQIT